MNLDWIIIGGGIHGVHIAARLLGEAGVEPERLRIVDPAPALLARWRACTQTTGMTHLRSPSVHNLGLNPFSLKHFAGKKQTPGLFVPPYERPALSLFNAHCDRVMETFSLAKLHIQERAVTCSIQCEGVDVNLSDGRVLHAKNIVLALGTSESPQWPCWASRAHPRVHHIFEPGFDEWPRSPEAVAVVGAGISAGQVALRLLDEGHKVHLISRHALRQHQFDSDPGYLGPKFMKGFKRESDVDRRRVMITNARHKGSMPVDLCRALQRAINRGQLSWYKDEILGVGTRDDAVCLLMSAHSGVCVDRILLATGFVSKRPGGRLVDELVESASLPCAQCGYPIVDSALRWHPRVYVSGPLAELELGPVSRNIAGARRASDRLVNAVNSAPLEQ